MPDTRTFMVEAYAPASSDFPTLSEHARRAEGIDAAAARIKHLRSILVPDDEICFHLHEADSADTVAHALHVGGLRAQRIVEVTM
jgi:hypothetical protein